jgi:hypothetical protein
VAQVSGRLLETGSKPAGRIIGLMAEKSDGPRVGHRSRLRPGAATRKSVAMHIMRHSTVSRAAGRGSHTLTGPDDPRFSPGSLL